MKRILLVGLLLAGSCLRGGARAQATSKPDDALMAKARQVARECMIIDTHIDTPIRLSRSHADPSRRLNDGEFDYVRAKGGGLDCAFMSIFVPAGYQNKKGAKAFAERLIRKVEGWVRTSQGKFGLARSVAEARAHWKAGRVSLAMGMENGAGLEDDLANVRRFHRRGIRYVTLVHSKDNLICDSSYDTTRTWNGLSPFGRRVVEEMNRAGIMVDISHVSDSAFFQVVRISKAPAIASHSSCRHFTPGFERNMSDDMIRLLAAKGGVIQINFGSYFIKDSYRTEEEHQEKVIGEHLKALGLRSGDAAGAAYGRKYRQEHPIKVADLREVADHIDHVVKLAGVDHVGLGSDFDGVGDSLPTGLKDVSDYPNLIYELLTRGYGDGDIRKICGENLLRVWSTVERLAEDTGSGG